jgi:hypothetical protein
MVRRLNNQTEALTAIMATSLMTHSVIGPSLFRSGPRLVTPDDCVYEWSLLSARFVLPSCVGRAQRVCAVILNLFLGTFNWLITFPALHSHGYRLVSTQHKHKSVSLCTVQLPYVNIIKLSFSSDVSVVCLLLHTELRVPTVWGSACGSQGSPQVSHVGLQLPR